MPEGDQLTYSDGRRFSTFDRDLHTSNDHCAQEFGGGWWYGDCMKSNLNGHYINLGFVSDGNTSGILWKHVDELQSEKRVALKLIAVHKI